MSTIFQGSYFQRSWANDQPFLNADFLFIMEQQPRCHYDLGIKPMMKNSLDGPSLQTTLCCITWQYTSSWITMKKSWTLNLHGQYLGLEITLQFCVDQGQMSYMLIQVKNCTRKVGLVTRKECWRHNSVWTSTSTWTSYLTGINHRPLPVSSQEENQQAVDSSVTLAIVIINLSTIVFCIVVSKEDFLIGPVSDLTSSLPTHTTSTVLQTYFVQTSK